MADIFSSWKIGGVMVDGYTFVEIRFYLDSILTWSNFTQNGILHFDQFRACVLQKL